MVQASPAGAGCTRPSHHPESTLQSLELEPDFPLKQFLFARPIQSCLNSMIHPCMCTQIPADLFNFLQVLNTLEQLLVHALPHSHWQQVKFLVDRKALAIEPRQCERMARKCPIYPPEACHALHTTSMSCHGCGCPNLSEGLQGHPLRLPLR